MGSKHVTVRMCSHSMEGEEYSTFIGAVDCTCPGDGSKAATRTTTSFVLDVTAHPGTNAPTVRSVRTWVALQPTDASVRPPIATPGFSTPTGFRCKIPSTTR